MVRFCRDYFTDFALRPLVSERFLTVQKRRSTIISRCLYTRQAWRKKWNEWGFKPPWCAYKLNWASKRREGDVGLWRLTASSVMHASRVRTPLIPSVFFKCNILISSFSMWLGDQGNGGLVELRLKPVYRRYFRAGQRTARSSTPDKHMVQIYCTPPKNITWEY